MRIDDDRRNDRIDHLKQLEHTLHVALENQEQQRKIDLDRLNQDFEKRRQQAEYAYHSQLQDEAISNMEQKATQRIMELMTIREREDKARQLRAEVQHRRDVEEAKEKVTMEKWKLEDQARRVEQELQVREKMRMRETEAHSADQRAMEMKHKVFELEKEMQMLNIEKERELRQLEEEFQRKTEQLRDEISNKDRLMSQEEERQARDLLNRERMNLEATNGAKLAELQDEHDDLQRAIDFEKAEQERIQRMTMKKEFEGEVIRMRNDQENRRRAEEIHIESLKHRVDEEKRSRMYNEEAAREREQTLQEKEHFQNILRETEQRLRTMEREKFDDFREQLRRELEEAERAKKEEYD